MKSELKEWGTETRIMFYCPGCRTHHAVPVQPPMPNGWNWNGDLQKPTLSPSLLTRWHDWETKTDKVCHIFVTDGNIQYLTDCTHELAGQTVPLEDLEG